MNPHESQRSLVCPVPPGRHLGGAGCARAVWAGEGGDATAAQPSKPAHGFDAIAKPFLEQHCIACHDGDVQEGNVRLDTLAADFANPDNAAAWADVFDKVASGEMPPKKKPRPDPADKAKLLAHLKAGLTAGDLTARKTDGRVVLRRLNRIEYENTVRDLLGVEVDVKELLPEDGMALGFDNVAAALNVSSVLMEKYLEAADVALDAAIAPAKRPETKHWDVSMSPDTKNPKDYRLNGGVRVMDNGTFVYFNSDGSTPIVCDRFRAPEPGRYRIKVNAYAFQSPTPLTMCILAGAFDPRSPAKTTVGFYDVLPGVEKSREFEFTLQLPKRGTIKILAFETNKRGVRNDTTAYAGPGVAVRNVVVDGPIYDAWPPASHTRLLGDLDVENATAADAERVLLPFATRAFRRPVTAGEVEPYVELVRENLASRPPIDPKQAAAAKKRPRPAGERAPFEEAIHVGLKAVLCSPDFLFLRERAGPLDGYALASRLSYFLTSSTPDEELLRHAADGSLKRPDVLRAQTERLLQAGRARQFTENFTGQWLGLRQIDFTAPDAKLYPEFDAQLQWSMLGETHRFFDEILQRDLSLLNFVDSDFTFLNGRLARHYGIEGIEGNELRRTQLKPGSHRGGVMAHGSVLKVTANGTTTSPVTRGVWVLRNLLGQPPKPPPPNTPAVEPDIRGATTIRQQIDAHRSSAACASCHARIDPPGNALECFDPIGGWRDAYRTFGAPTGIQPQTKVFEYRVGYKFGPKVDAADKLHDGRAFKDFDELKQLLLADKDQVARCLTEKLLVYSTGGGTGFADRDAVDEIVRKSAARGYGFRSLVHDVVQSPLFLNK